ncbi:MAG: glycosyltransferase family 4 protein [Dactylosporangium sp.]|nr:glycosyltransferase family 4 protein [Dactylosporangium sp.]NNJ62389.1 glycosyltransferase family 4 protein [Dactylosporangium sp.]
MTKPLSANNRRSLLFLAPKWTGSNGGDTVNRDLARALANLGFEVFVRVSEEYFEPESMHSNLIVNGLVPFPGVSLKERANLFRREGLPREVDIIVGHGRLTGGAAQYLQQQVYPTAARVQFVHADTGAMDVRRNLFGTREQLAAGIEESESHEREEVLLIEGAALTIGVGPVLTAYASKLASQCGNPPQVYDMFPGVEVFDQPLLSGDPKKINLLLLGRVDDPIKGVDIAANMVRELRGRGYTGFGSDGKPEVNLIIRGANPDTVSKITGKVSRMADCAVEVRPFTADRKEIQSDIRAASVLLMPSRLEGFGLVGTEGLGNGVPVLVSGCSGLGEVLSDPNRFPNHMAELFVVPMTGKEPTENIVGSWADKLMTIIDDLPEARVAAATVQSYLAQTYTWDHVARALGSVLEGLPRGSVSSSNINPVTLGFTTGLGGTQAGQSGGVVAKPYVPPFKSNDPPDSER